MVEKWPEIIFGHCLATLTFANQLILEPKLMFQEWNAKRSQ